MINHGQIDENKYTTSNLISDDNGDIDKDEEKENINEMDTDIKKNKITKFYLSNKSTETKNTLIPNESKFFQNESKFTS